MEDNRSRQADREACCTLGLYAFFFVWWFGFAFGLGAGDPAEYTYVWGMPAWFFYSCIVGYPVICLLLWAVVRRCFRIMPLEAEDSDTMPEVVETAQDAGSTTPASAERKGGSVGTAPAGGGIPE